ncbi:MAG: sigma-70 factor domain-containing protein, partial [Acidimicrobiales bacterium]
MGIAAEDVLGQYLVDIRRHRLLTKQDEVRLSQAVEAGQRAAAELEAAAEGGRRAGAEPETAEG